MTLHLAGGRDVFVYRKPDFEPATYTILNFEVDDIDAAVDGLASKGVELRALRRLRAGREGHRPRPRPPIAWFKDPAGNILSVLQQPCLSAVAAQARAALPSGRRTPPR